MRDVNSDYLFMLLSVLESAVEAAHAAREQKLMQRLREEIDAKKIRQVAKSFKPAAAASAEANEY